MEWVNHNWPNMWWINEVTCEVRTYFDPRLHRVKKSVAPLERWTTFPHESISIPILFGKLSIINCLLSIPFSDLRSNIGYPLVPFISIIRWKSLNKGINWRGRMNPKVYARKNAHLRGIVLFSWSLANLCPVRGHPWCRRLTGSYKYIKTLDA